MLHFLPARGLIYIYWGCSSFVHVLQIWSATVTYRKEFIGACSNFDSHWFRFGGLVYQMVHRYIIVPSLRNFWLQDHYIEYWRSYSFRRQKKNVVNNNDAPILPLVMTSTTILYSFHWWMHLISMVDSSMMMQSAVRNFVITCMM